jgi:hypothetical protein
MPFVPRLVAINTKEARVLAVLADAETRGAYLTSDKIASAADYSSAGTVGHALYGINPHGRSTGKYRPGLVKLRYATKEVLDIEGLPETTFGITPLGKEALAERLKKGPLPAPKKDRHKYTNKRYLID